MIQSKMDSQAMASTGDSIKRAMGSCKNNCMWTVTFYIRHDVKTNGVQTWCTLYIYCVFIQGFLYRITELLDTVIQSCACKDQIRYHLCLPMISLSLLYPYHSSSI